MYIFCLSNPCNYMQTRGSFWARCAKLHAYHPGIVCALTHGVYGTLWRFYTCVKQNSKDWFSCHLGLLLSMCPHIFSHPCVFMRWEEAVKYILFPPTVENRNKNLDSCIFSPTSLCGFAVCSWKITSSGLSFYGFKCECQWWLLVMHEA